MRRSLSLLLLSMFALPAWLVLNPVAGAAEPAKPDQAPARHARLSPEQNFTQANLAHDGHLTLDEAKDGFALVARHFDDIDVDHKGYVTQNDIRVWRIMKKAAHRLTKPPADIQKPFNAMQRASIGPTAVTASTMQVIEMPSDRLPLPEGRADKD